MDRQGRKAWFKALEGDPGSAIVIVVVFDASRPGVERSKSELLGDVGDMVLGVVVADHTEGPSAVVVAFETAELVLLSLPRLCMPDGASCTCCGRTTSDSADNKLLYRLRPVGGAGTGARQTYESQLQGLSYD